MNARRSPQWILAAHLPNERAQLLVDPGSARGCSRFPAPERPEAGPVPADHSLRFHYSDCMQERREHSINAKVQRPVEPAQLHALGRLSPQNIELMA